MDPKHLQGDISGFEGSMPGNWQIRQTGKETVDEDADRHDPLSMSMFWFSKPWLRSNSLLVSMSEGTSLP